MLWLPLELLLLLLFILEVIKAFKSARWSAMVDALLRTLLIPKYLFRMIRDYLSNKTLLYDISHMYVELNRFQSGHLRE